MRTKTDIVNYAIRRLGEGDKIEDFDTDDSEAAQAARTFYPSLLEEKLREFRWHWAEQTGTLGLVKENPNADWAYSYRYPSGNVDFRRILNGDRSGLNLPPVPFQLYSDKQGLLIYTDYPNAQGEWTNIDPPLKIWPSDFKTAFATELGSLMAPSVMKDDGGAAKERFLLSVAMAKWKRAKANSSREKASDPKPVSKAQQARGSGAVRGRHFPDRPATA